MKPLDFPFQKHGFWHELLKREGLICLVRRSKRGLWHYEVVQLRIKPAHEFKGVHYPEAERYPVNEDWGGDGFTYLATDPEMAVKRYTWLKEGRKVDWPAYRSIPIAEIEQGEATCREIR